MLILINF